MLTIREFEKRYGAEFNIKYQAIYRMIKKGVFKKGKEYKEVHKAQRSSYLLNTEAVLNFLEGGK